MEFPNIFKCANGFVESLGRAGVCAGQKFGYGRRLGKHAASRCRSDWQRSGTDAFDSACCLGAGSSAHRFAGPFVAAPSSRSELEGMSAVIQSLAVTVSELMDKMTAMESQQMQDILMMADADLDGTAAERNVLRRTKG